MSKIVDHVLSEALLEGAKDIGIADGLTSSIKRVREWHDSHPTGTIRSIDITRVLSAAASWNRAKYILDAIETLEKELDAEREENRRLIQAVHPWYGPCDALDNGLCSVCIEVSQWRWPEDTAPAKYVPVLQKEIANNEKALAEAGAILRNVMRYVYHDDGCPRKDPRSALNCLCGLHEAIPDWIRKLI